MRLEHLKTLEENYSSGDAKPWWKQDLARGKGSPGTSGELGGGTGRPGREGRRVGWCWLLKAF